MSDRRVQQRTSRSDTGGSPRVLELGTAAHITFLAFGVSSLLPWSAVVLALPFFLGRLSETPFHDTFASWLTFLLNGATLLSMGVATWSGGRLTGPSVCVFSMVIMVFLFGLLAVIPFFDLPAAIFFTAIISISVVLSSTAGFLQTFTIALAPKYGSSAITSYMAGSALCAIGVSALQVFTAYTSTGVERSDLDSASWSAMVCFATAAMASVLTLISFHVLVGGVHDFRCYDHEDSVNQLASERTRLITSNIEPASRSSPNVTTPRNHKTHFRCNFAIFYSSVVTLAVLPALTTLIEPIDPRINPLIFNALHFLMFNIADLLGRILASTPIFPNDDTVLLVYSLGRTIFIPIFLVCNVPGHWSTIITSDAMYMLILFLFGLTGGHSTTLALISAAEKDDPASSGEAAQVTQFWMMSGFVAGGIASFGVIALL